VVERITACRFSGDLRGQQSKCIVGGIVGLVVTRGASVRSWATASVTIAQGGIFLLIIVKVIMLSATAIQQRGLLEGDRTSASTASTSVVAASSDSSPSSALLGKRLPQVGLSMGLIGGVAVGLDVEMTRRLMSLSALEESDAFMFELFIVELIRGVIRGLIRGVEISLVVERFRRLVSLNTLWARKEFSSDLIIVWLWCVSSVRWARLVVMGNLSAVVLISVGDLSPLSTQIRALRLSRLADGKRRVSGSQNSEVCSGGNKLVKEIRGQPAVQGRVVDGCGVCGGITQLESLRIHDWYRAVGVLRDDGIEHFLDKIGSDRRMRNGFDVDRWMVPAERLRASHICIHRSVEGCAIRFAINSWTPNDVLITVVHGEQSYNLQEIALLECRRYRLGRVGGARGGEKPGKAEPIVK
jgi:hypothetical protein